ncbi:MAG: hypothetical protein MZU95_02330 [Desulfomicrobium escambiense]|nr:hypothetical protein [Desulfomicrobium escambiense]
MPPVLQGKVLVLSALRASCPGIEVKFGADGLGAHLRAGGLVPVDPRDRLQHRLHALAQGARPDALLLLLRGGHLRRRGGRALAANVFTLYLFYEVITRLHLPAGGPPPGRGGLPRRAQVPGLPHGHLQALPAAGHGPDLRALRHARLPPGRHQHAASSRRTPNPALVTDHLRPLHVRASPRRPSCRCTTGCPRPWWRPPRSRPCCTRWPW